MPPLPLCSRRLIYSVIRKFTAVKYIRCHWPGSCIDIGSATFIDRILAGQAESNVESGRVCGHGYDSKPRSCCAPLWRGIAFYRGKCPPGRAQLSIEVSAVCGGWPCCLVRVYF